MFNDWQSVLTLATVLLLAAVVILWIGSIAWTYRDIRERTRDSWSQTVALALVVVFNFVGLLVYLMMRPRETLAETYERRLETEAIRRDLSEQLRSCPSCARPVDDEFLLCPFCRARLREPCTACGRALELAWVACPYCGGAGPQQLRHGATPASTPATPPQPAAAQTTPGTPPPANPARSSPRARSSQ